MSSTAVVGSVALFEQYLQPCVLRTFARVGVTVLPHCRHCDGHGRLRPGYGSIGSSPFASISARAALSVRRSDPEQNRQGPLPLETTLEYHGVISLPQAMQRQRQGVFAPGNGSTGSAPRSRIEAAAAAG